MQVSVQPLDTHQRLPICCRRRNDQQRKRQCQRDARGMPDQDAGNFGSEEFSHRRFQFLNQGAP